MNLNLVYLRIGDVIAHSGAEWVVVMTNECRALCRCLSRRERVVEDKLHGAVKRFANRAEEMSICTRIQPDMILRNMREQLTETKTKTKTEKSSIMAKNTTETKTEKTATKTSAGSLGGLFGQSITSVLRRLGVEGVSTAHAREIMKAMKIQTSDITVSIQVNNGKNGKGGDPAELTGAQLKQLLTSAKDPKKAPKAEKPAAKPAAPAKKGGKPAAKPAKPSKSAKPAVEEDEEEGTQAADDDLDEEPEVDDED